MASKQKRLAKKIARKTNELNLLMKEAHSMQIEIQAILDIKQLPFPILLIRLLKEM